jgi:hypothetical protein
LGARRPESRRLRADPGPGATVGPAERSEINGLLSGSPDAVTALAKLTAAAAADVEQIVRSSFGHGFQAGMILCAALSLAGVAVAMIAAGTKPALISDRRRAQSDPRAPSGGLRVLGSGAPSSSSCSS